MRCGQSLLLCCVILFKSNGANENENNENLMHWLYAEKLEDLMHYFAATDVTLSFMRKRADSASLIEHLEALNIPHTQIATLIYRLKRERDSEQFSQCFHPQRLGSKFMTQHFLQRNLSFHKDGILFHLGTKFGTKPWINAAVRGLVTLNSSGCEREGPSIDRVLSRLPVGPFLSPTTPSPWLSFDFGAALRVKPTAYALICSVDFDHHFVRHWRLEGSNDDAEWTVLREHKNDLTLRGRGHSHSWTLSGVDSFYRRFRIRFTGKDSCECFLCHVLSGI